MSDREGKPIWLLDIDGVLNTYPVRPKHMWDEFEEHLVTDLSTGKEFRLIMGVPVIEFICEVWAQEIVDIRWHTTWQDSAAEVAKAFGLPPDIPVLDAPEFDRWKNRTSRGWWKVGAAKRVLESTHVPVIWTDDDLGVYWLNQMQRDGVDMSKLKVICPDSQTGLSPAHLAKIEHVIDDWMDSL